MRAYDAPSRFGFRSVVADEASAFLSAVYGWMCAGLVITAATAWCVAGSPIIVHTIASNGVVFWSLAIFQLAIVFVLSARVQQLAASTAVLLFVLYSTLTGATLSFVLLAYTGESVATTFLVAAGMFGGLAAYGTTTKRPRNEISAGWGNSFSWACWASCWRRLSESSGTATRFNSC